MIVWKANELERWEVSGSGELVELSLPFLEIVVVRVLLVIAPEIQVSDVLKAWFRREELPDAKLGRIRNDLRPMLIGLRQRVQRKVSEAAVVAHRQTTPQRRIP